MLDLLTPAGRAGQRLVLWGAAALLLVTLPCLLLGCPGELEDPDRFDAGAGGGSSSGTGGSTSSSSSSSSSTSAGTAGGGGSSSGAGGAGGG
ncbi:MAG: hypothetical protein JRI68_18425 [Deltaproteobacteria bacterium]|nr:hypothetical protein [Deltaproteobacteria bacterium]